MARTEYPDTLTEVERVELASALSFHFDHCPDELEYQYEIICAVVTRMIRRRSGVIG